MSGDMERIMREIHVMFAKAEKVSEKEDMILVDKKRVFTLLESLNREVYDAMDRYGESQASRELAIQEFKRETDEMMEKASGNAEEIYAASILYSDSTLRELEAEVEHARESIKETWENIDKRLEEQLGFLVRNRRELKDQLEEMGQSRIYLELIDKAKCTERAETEEQKSLNRTGRQKTEAGQKPQEESGLTEEQKRIEIHVAEAYRDRVEALEYPAYTEDRKAEQEEMNGVPGSYGQNNRKGLKDIFKRVK